MSSWNCSTNKTEKTKPNKTGSKLQQIKTTNFQTAKVEDSRQWENIFKTLRENSFSYKKLTRANLPPIYPNWRTAKADLKKSI